MKQRKYCFFINKIVYFVNKPIPTKTIFKIAFLIMICFNNTKICKIENNWIFRYWIEYQIQKHSTNLSTSYIYIANVYKRNIQFFLEI